MTMTSLLHHHIEETKDRFTEVKEELREINGKLDNIHGFRMESLATARLVSLICSGAIGFLTMAGTLLLAYYSRH